MPKFDIGNQVTWTSQAQGFSKVKTGKVEAVIPAGRPLSEDQRSELPGAGVRRSHESYLVRVPGKTPAARSKLYWPTVSRLKRA